MIATAPRHSRVGGRLFGVFKLGFIGEFEELLYGSLREGAGAEGD